MMRVIILSTSLHEQWVGFANLPHSVASVKAKEVLYDLTKQQLEEWGVKYHELIMGKPHADYFIDDKGVNADEFFLNNN